MTIGGIWPKQVLYVFNPSWVLHLVCSQCHIYSASCINAYRCHFQYSCSIHCAHYQHYIILHMPSVHTRLPRCAHYQHYIILHHAFSTHKTAEVCTLPTLHHTPPCLQYTQDCRGVHTTNITSYSTMPSVHTRLPRCAHYQHYIILHHAFSTHTTSMHELLQMLLPLQCFSAGLGLPVTVYNVPRCPLPTLYVQALMVHC